MREEPEIFHRKLAMKQEIIYLWIKDNSINVLLINAVLYESLMRKNRDNTEIIRHRLMEKEYT